MKLSYAKENKVLIDVEIRYFAGYLQEIRLLKKETVDSCYEILLYSCFFHLQDLIRFKPAYKESTKGSISLTSN